MEDHKREPTEKKESFLSRAKSGILTLTKYFFIFLLLYLVVRYVFLPNRLPTAKLSYSEKAAPLPSASKIGHFLPSLNVRLIDGGMVNTQNYKGKVLILNFFATWCPPCRFEMPDMNELLLKYREKGLEVIAVVVDDSKDELEEFVKEVNVSFPVGYPEYTSQMRMFPLYGLPTSYIIDKRGVIREIIPGAIDWKSKEIIKRITELFEE